MRIQLSLQSIDEHCRKAHECHSNSESREAGKHLSSSSMAAYSNVLLSTGFQALCSPK